MDKILVNLTEGKSEEVLDGMSGKPVRIWTNPTRSDVLALVGRFGELRGSVAIPDGVVFIWRANEAIHYSGKRAILSAIRPDAPDVTAVFPLWSDFYLSHASSSLPSEWVEEGFAVPLDDETTLYVRSADVYYRLIAGTNFGRAFKIS